MPVSNAQKKAVNKYQKNHYDEIKLRVKKGERERIKKDIFELGYDSVSKFMVDATNEKIKREQDKRGITLVNDIKYQTEIAKSEMKGE